MKQRVKKGEVQKGEFEHSFVNHLVESWPMRRIDMALFPLPVRQEDSKLITNSVSVGRKGVSNLKTDFVASFSSYEFLFIQCGVGEQMNLLMGPMLHIPH